MLTIIGFFVTTGIAIFGFRTFERWKREKIEEKRIDIAIEALELAYECQEAFEVIRNPGTLGLEYADMPRRDGEGEPEWSHRGPFYAILKRVQEHAGMFERLAKLRPRYMALFGVPAADSFKLIREARAYVVVSAQHLCYRPFVGPDAQNQRTRMECDVWDGLAEVYLADYPGVDRVEVRIKGFVEETERRCRPIIDRTYAAQKSKRWWWSKK
ncbi:hypothetical protein [Bradyrhizobium diazoefficiens]|uniref:hypothetical protein n=1 Tax=Bradyrhizobium diazoefficiens TaxID=1355477 RepID=UPI0027144DE5|nr:hypothetical protein [Bradyrhizobium diazoefficiens]WLB40271.1 hypothetical protein QIH78_10920 [Bradyrhizobium diazoefficiens]WLC14755.1 hypothetical protein QIH76_32130 [Bradyrhizobium diazoefficiens]